MISRRAVLALPVLVLPFPAIAAGRAIASPPDAPLAAALALEHEAVHTFGELGAQLDDATKELVRALDAEHRLQRDRVAEAMRAAGTTPAAALPAYALPTPVSDRLSAIEVLLVLEEALVRAYSAVVAAPVSTADRSLAAELLSRNATHLTALRFARARSLIGSTDAFPGRG